jgi:hypothetical protein
MPRFVLLRHECPPGFGPPSHWDLMLEDGEALLAFRLLELPTAGRPTVAAEALARHRIEYLDYEGPVSGGRGDVRQVDAGAFRWLERTPLRASLEAAGQVLRGVVTLDGDREVGGGLQVTCIAVDA